MNEDQAKKRLALIEKKQELLKNAVGDLQRILYEAILNQIEAIAENPAEMNRMFDEFNANHHAKVLKTFASDIMSIGAMNAEYFIEAAKGIDAKDYSAIQSKANDQILSRFGLDKSGKMVKGGFIDSFANDESIKRQLTQYGYKAKISGVGLMEFKKGFKDLIIGEKGKTGGLEKHYKTWAYDTYQQVDSSLQQFYSEKLGLEAFLYLGGLIAGSRPFCVARNGKVFLREEIEEWKNLDFAGKPANYNPFLDRGGYNCRHIPNAITARMAVARRSDLYIDENGKLQRGEKPVAEDAKPKEETFADQKEFSKEAFEKYPEELNPDFWNNFDDDMKIGLQQNRIDFDGNPEGAYYHPRDKFLHLNTKKAEFTDSPYYRRYIVYHEGGHAMHMNRNIVTEYAIAPDLKKVIAKCEKNLLMNPELAKLDAVLFEAGKASYLKEFEPLRKAAANGFPLQKEAMKVLDEFKDVKPDDLATMISIVRDTMGALTRGTMDGGHSFQYYNTGTRSAMEFFAHASNSYFAKEGNPVMAKYFPEIEKEMKAYMKKVDTRKNQTARP